MSLLWLDNPDTIELETLFIQPTRWCGMKGGCEDKCYVKNHEGGEDGYHLPINEWLNFITDIWTQRNIKTKQVTLSVDNLPEDEEKYHYMLLIFDYFYKNRKSNTEYHITCQSPKVFRSYTSDRGASVKERANFLDLISFSYINKTSYIKNLRKYTKVCWNMMMPRNITSLTIDEHIEKVIRIGREVDIIHLIMPKSPIGAARNDLIKISEKHNMISDFRYINTLQEKLPSDVRRKLHIDGCLQDTIQSTKTGFGCNANISKFQVWPDGSVSGCPYAFSGNTKRARTANDILENIREARKQYDFRDRCHLPQLYNSISK